MFAVGAAIYCTVITLNKTATAARQVIVTLGLLQYMLHVQQSLSITTVAAAETNTSTHWGTKNGGGGSYADGYSVAPTSGGEEDAIGLECLDRQTDIRL